MYIAMLLTIILNSANTTHSDITQPHSYDYTMTMREILSGWDLKAYNVNVTQ